MGLIVHTLTHQNCERFAHYFISIFTRPEVERTAAAIGEEDVGPRVDVYLDSLPITIIKFGHNKILSWLSLMAWIFFTFQKYFSVVCITHSLNVSIKQLWSAKCSDWSFFVVAVRPESETMCT